MFLENLKLTSVPTIIAAAPSECGKGGCDERPTFEALSDLGDSISKRSDALNLIDGFCDPAAQPTSGSASSDGALLATSASLIVIGELELLATFDGKDSVGGTARCCLTIGIPEWHLQRRQVARRHGASKE